jgi:protein TonB
VVLLKVLIDKDGSVKNALILSSSGYTLLDNSAMEAVLKWKFEPLIIDGKKSLSWVKIPIEFIIK